MLLHFFYSLLWDIPPEKQKVPQLRNWGAFCFSLFPFSFLNVHPVRKAGVGFAVGVVLGYGLLTLEKETNVNAILLKAIKEFMEE